MDDIRKVEVHSACGALFYVAATRCSVIKESDAHVLVLNSTCPSGKSGGSLGEFGPGQMVKEFNDVVFTTGKVGKVEGPVKTQFGYHLILITKRGDESM